MLFGRSCRGVPSYFLKHGCRLRGARQSGRTAKLALVNMVLQESARGGWRRWFAHDGYFAAIIVEKDDARLWQQRRRLSWRQTLLPLVALYINPFLTQK